MTLGRGPKDLICSSRGCEEPAQFAITWTNPTLPFGREKNWLACQEHKGELERYLNYRKFPLKTVPLSEFLRGRNGAGESKSTGVPKEG